MPSERPRWLLLRPFEGWRRRLPALASRRTNEEGNEARDEGGLGTTSELDRDVIRARSPPLPRLPTYLPIAGSATATIWNSHSHHHSAPPCALYPSSSSRGAHRRRVASLRALTTTTLASPPVPSLISFPSFTQERPRCRCLISSPRGAVRRRAGASKPWRSALASPAWPWSSHHIATAGNGPRAAAKRVKRSWS